MNNKEGFSHLPADWQRAIFAFLDDKFARSGSTETYQKYGSILVRFFAGHPQPDEVTRTDVGDFLRKLSAWKGHQSQPPSATVRNNRRSVLSQFYAYASEFEIAPGVMLFAKSSPVRGFHDVKVGLVDKSMSQEQVERFFAAIPRDTVKGKRDYALFLFYFLTARRRSEIQRVRVRDIEEVVFVDGGTRRSGHRFHFRGKGHSRVDDTQELPSLVMDAIRDYWGVSGRQDPKPDEPVFVSQVLKNGRKVQLTGYWINKMFKQYALVAGLPTVLTLHSLRHGSARARAEQGESIVSISRTLRHSSLAITTRYLSGLVTDEDKGSALLANLPFLASGKEGK